MYLKLHILDNCTYPGTVEHLNTVNLSLNLRIAQAPPASFPPLFPGNFGRKSCKLQARSRGQRELRCAAEVMEKWRKRMPLRPRVTSVKSLPATDVPAWLERQLCCWRALCLVGLISNMDDDDGIVRVFQLLSGAGLLDLHLPSFFLLHCNVRHLRLT